jgi:hypothetical protein
MSETNDREQYFEAEWASAVRKKHEMMAERDHAVQWAQEQQAEVARLRGLVAASLAFVKSQRTGSGNLEGDLIAALTAEAKPEAPTSGTIGRTPKWRENAGNLAAPAGEQT